MGGIPASERTRERLKALIDGQSEEGDLRSALVRLAARLLALAIATATAGDD